MHIAIIGTGGIGGPLGASLLKAGINVTLVARGAHLTAMRENGLHVKGDRGENLVRPVQVTDNLGDIGTVDFALVCVKSWDVEPVGRGIRAIVGPQTAVIPLQNGVDAAQRLIPILGHAPVMGGVAFVTGTIIAPGVIQQTGTHQRLIMISATTASLGTADRRRSIASGGTAPIPAVRWSLSNRLRSPLSGPAPSSPYSTAAS